MTAAIPFLSPMGDEQSVVACVVAGGVGVCILLLYRGLRNKSGGPHNSTRHRLQRALANDRLDIESIAAECKTKQRPWKDPSFGHDGYPGPSIGGPSFTLREGERGKVLQFDSASGITWQPPSQFCSTSRPLGVRGVDGVPTWLYSDVNGDGVVSAVEGMQLYDATQGSVGDCYFLSALAAAVHQQPDLCDDLIEETYEEQGIYGVSFWVGGKWRMIWVDGYFPCYKTRSRSGRGKKKYRLLFAKPTDRKEIWPLVVEKAFAKLHGSYEAIAGGHIADALELLTGHRAKRHNIPSSMRTMDTKQWKNFKAQVQSVEFLVGAGSQAECIDKLEANEQRKTMQGIVTGHAYTVVNAYSDDPVESTDSMLRLVELRNPWGSTEWTGDWSKGSRLWETEEGRRVQQTLEECSAWRKSERGRFWMPLDAFCECFVSIDVCHMPLTDEQRQRRAELKEEAERIVAEHPKHGKSNNNSSTTTPEYTRESADAMMELLIAEEAKEKRMKQIGSRGNKQRKKKRA